MRERLGEELWGSLKLVVHGMDGVLMNLLGHTGWDYGRILGGVEGCFQVILDLRWEMPPRLDSSMICMVWRQDPKGSLSKFIWYCLRE